VWRGGLGGGGGSGGSIFGRVSGEKPGLVYRQGGLGLGGVFWVVDLMRGSNGCGDGMHGSRRGK